MINFDKIEEFEENFRKNEKYGDCSRDTFEFSKGDIPVILTAPHTTRTINFKTGEVKSSEFYTGALVLLAREFTGCHVMARYNHNKEIKTIDDAKICMFNYYKKLSEYIEKNKISFLIDVHGLSIKSSYDIAVGTNYKKYLFNELIWEEIINNAFSKRNIGTSYDSKFQASTSNTISRFIYDSNNIKAAQFEINGKFRNPKNDFDSFQNVYYGLEECVNEINHTLKLKK